MSADQQSLLHSLIKEMVLSSHATSDQQAALKRYLSARSYYHYPSYIFEHSYVTSVLGIRMPINESILCSSAFHHRIIQEHLLFEGFWGELYQKGKDKLLDTAAGIKKFGKEAWGVLKAFYEIIKGGNAGSFMGSIAKKGIQPILKPIRKALVWLVEKFSNWNMPTFLKMAQKALDVIQTLSDKLESLDGWKGVIAFAGYAIGLHWLWNKIGDWIDELKEKVGGAFTLSEADDSIDLTRSGEAMGNTNIGNDVKNWIKDTITDKLQAITGDAFMGIMKKLASAFTGIKSWWDAAVKVAGGIKLVIDALGSAASRFLSREQSKKDITRSISGSETAGNSAQEGIIRKYIASVLSEGGLDNFLQKSERTDQKDKESETDPI